MAKATAIPATAIPAPILTLLHADVPRGESPGQHLRNAIQLLILADERVGQLTIPADPTLTDLIRGAEARCFRALFEWESQ